MAASSSDTQFVVDAPTSELSEDEQKLINLVAGPIRYAVTILFESERKFKLDIYDPADDTHKIIDNRLPTFANTDVRIPVQFLIWCPDEFESKEIAYEVIARDVRQEIIRRKTDRPGNPLRNITMHMTGGPLLEGLVILNPPVEMKSD